MKYSDEFRGYIKDGRSDEMMDRAKQTALLEKLLPSLKALSLKTDDMFCLREYYSGTWLTLKAMDRGTCGQAGVRESHQKTRRL